MAQSIETLPQKVQDAIRSESLEKHTQHHMPISIYTSEMGMRADLLREHSQSYLAALRFDITPLADEIDLVKEALIKAELDWVDGQKEQDAKTRFWYGNKERLYSLNSEIRPKLDFHFMMTDNEHGAKVLKEIGTSDNDNDAVHDGRREGKLLTDYRDSIAGTVFTAEEIDEFIQFYKDIEDAKEAAEVDRTAPNEERILRDKVYCYLRKLEGKVRKASKACFHNNPVELSRYESAYNRKNNRNQRS